MSKRSAIDWLSDIISWGERLEGHIADMTQEDFLDDTKTQDAASKCAEAIGMAAHELNNLNPFLDREFPDLQLNLAYKSRNRLSRGYFGSMKASSGAPSRNRYRRRSQQPNRRSSNTAMALLAARKCKGAQTLM